MRSSDLSDAVLDRRATPSSNGRAQRRRQAIVWLVAMASAVGAVLAGNHPTGAFAGDAVAGAGFAVAVCYAGSRARRWSLVVLAAVASVAAVAQGVVGLLALAALGGALAQVVLDRRDRVTGALIAAASTQVLLRLPAIEPTALVVVLVGVATVPVLGSGYQAARRRERTVARRIVAVSALAALLFSLAFVVIALEGRADLDRGVDLGERGLDALRVGDSEAAADLLERSADAFASAHADLTSPLAQPARAIPLVGQQATASREIAIAGREIAEAAEVAATQVDVGNLAITDATVDLRSLATMEQPAAEALDRLRVADERVAAIDRSWLLPLVAGPVVDLGADLDDTVRQAESVVAGLDAAPWLLGADAPRRYLVAFGTPAESRGLGGFIGSYGILSVTDGRLEMEHTGPISELERAEGSAGRTLSGPPEFLARYGRYYPARFLKNASASPDFPTVARVLQELYPQSSGGQQVDGVLYLDPFALAALLEITGPVDVEGLDEPLDAETAPNLLLRRQYSLVPDSADRRDVLGAAAEATFAALTSQQLAGPGELAEVLTPVARRGRLLFQVTDPSANRFLDRIGLGGEFPAPDGGDFLSVRTANAGANKLDAYLSRDITYRAEFDPGTGGVHATATITLTNEAPDGLPDYVAGNADARAGRPGPAAGTNLTMLSVYSALGLSGATMDGQTLPVEVQDELGHHVYSAPVTVPRGSSVQIEVLLEGTIDAGRYDLTFSQQPLAIPDEVDLEVTDRRGGGTEAIGLDVPKGDATVRLSAEVDSD